MGMSDAEIAAVSTLAGVVLGFSLTEAKQWLERRRRAKAHYISLRAEVEECASQAETYIGAKISSPLYRLPVDAYRRAIEVLTADGTIDADALQAMRRFYATVEELNRGLDRIAEGTLSGTIGEAHAGHEMKRNALKAERLKRDGEHYKTVNAALTRRSA